MLAGYKTLIGIVLTAIGQVLKMTGFDVGVADSAVIEWTAIVEEVLTWGGMALALYGRIVASTSFLSKDPM